MLIFRLFAWLRHKLWLLTLGKAGRRRPAVSDEWADIVALYKAGVRSWPNRYIDRPHRFEPIPMEWMLVVPEQRAPYGYVNAEERCVVSGRLCQPATVKPNPGVRCVRCGCALLLSLSPDQNGITHESYIPSCPSCRLDVEAVEPADDVRLRGQLIPMFDTGVSNDRR